MDSKDSKDPQEPGVTMSDFLNDMINEEEVAQNILAKEETKDCTNPKGYSTQTIFGCLTCGAKGGMCLACYLNCHLDHDTFEIGLKRNFRCDCGTGKFDKHPCVFKEENAVIEENEKNNYDHNFEAKFCSCNQAYDTDLFMIRCLHCLDFYHLHHLNLKEDIQSIVEGNEDYTQMICGTCKQKYYNFLELYKDKNIFFTEEEIKANANEEQEEKKDNPEKEKTNEPPVVLGKRPRSTETPCDVSEKLKELPPSTDDSSIFMKDNWNNNLCYCDECQKLYKKNNVVEVLEEELVNAESWEQPQPQAAGTAEEGEQDGSMYNKGMQELSKLDFATQGLIASLYRDFYDDFKDFFEKFKENQTLITQNHIQEFFAYLKTKNKEELPS